MNSSTLTVVTTEISSLTNTSFTTATTVQFTGVDGPAVKFQLHTADVSWDQESSTTMVTLSDSNTLTVRNDHESTMTSQATVDNSEAFADFNTYLMHADSGTWKLSGTAYVTYIVKAKVNLDKSLVFNGYNNFSVPPVVQSTNLTNGTLTTLYSVASVTVTSQSNVQFNLAQDMYYRLFFGGQQVGIGYIPKYSIYPGAVTQTSYIQFSYNTAAQQAALMQMLSYYTCGLNSNLTLQNFYIDPPITWMTSALDSISMDSSLPGTEDKLIIQITIYNKGNPTKLPFSLQLYNPQAIPVTMYSLVSNVTYKNTVIAKVNIPSIDPPIVIPPYQNVTSQQLPSTSYVNSASAQLLAAGGGIGATFNYIGANFSEFPTKFYYYQYNVTFVVK